MLYEFIDLNREVIICSHQGSSAQPPVAVGRTPARWSMASRCS